MGRVRKALSTLTLIMATLVLAGCVAQFRNHGYAPTDEELGDVLIGLDTRDSVIDTFGPPTTGGVLQDSAVYYVASRWRYYGAFKPQIIDRQLVAFSFSADGLLSNVERFTLQDGRVVALSRRVTNSGVTNTGFIRQLLGNLGRLDNTALFGN